MQYSANISMLFSGTMLERLDLAKRANFNYIEMWSPPTAEINDIISWKNGNDVTFHMINTPPGSSDGDEWGTLSIPGREAFFRKTFSRTVQLAQQLDCQTINVLVGKNTKAWSDQELTDTLNGNLEWALANSPENIALVLETLNNLDFPGSILCDLDQADKVIQMSNSNRVRLLYDIYHVSRMGLSIAKSVEKHFRQIGHIQIADFPGRHQPGTGEVDFHDLFSLLHRLGYEGLIGLEYVPIGISNDAFSWIKKYSIDGEI